MRGKVRNVLHEMGGQRITPAYAGKSQHSDRQRVGRWDHPRLCGEKYVYFCQLVQTIGSPPPMRGKAAGFLPQYSLRGITPAYAGKSRKV